MPPHRAGANILRIVPALLTGRQSFNCHAFGAFFVFRLNSELGLELGLAFWIRLARMQVVRET